MRLLRILLVLGACLHLTGGAYGVLQCIAWTKMLVDYSSRDGLLEGARKTFDGEHPCEMCKSIAAAKQTEKEQPAPLTPSPRDLELKPVPLPLPAHLLSPPGRELASAALPEPLQLSSGPSQAPPVPPPRAA